MQSRLTIHLFERLLCGCILLACLTATIVAAEDKPAATPEKPAAPPAPPAASSDKPAAAAPDKPADKPEPAKALPKLNEFGRWIIAADYTSDGSTLVTAGGESLLYRPGDVVVWKADGTRLAELAGHPTAVWAVQVSADGKLAATAGYDGLVKLWDLPGKKLKADLKKHKGWVRSLAFSPDR